MASRNILAFLLIPVPAMVACGPPTAGSIVARAAEAMMVSGDIDDLTTLRIRTVFPDHEYPVITEFRRPDRMRTEGVGNYVLVFDGERAAFLESPPAGDGTPRGPELVDSTYVRDFELDIALVFPAFFDHPSEYLGIVPLDSVETHALRVVLPRGIPVTYYLDPETWLPLKVTADVTVDDTEYHPERVFSEHQDMGGIMYARTFTYSWMPDAVETATVESVEVNVPLGDDRFAIPEDLAVPGEGSAGTEPAVDADGNAYGTVQIGGRVWMAENLRVRHDPAGNPVASFFFEDDSVRFAGSGRLYTWDVAMNNERGEGARGICPEGWHLPSDAEWTALFDGLGGEGDARGVALLAGGSTGFDAELSGGADVRGNYVYRGEEAMFWSSTEVSGERAYHHGVNRDGVTNRFAALKGAGIHVRCLRDGG